MDNDRQLMRPACESNYKILTPADAAGLFRGRNLYIWGAGQKGRGFMLALQRNGFTVRGFLDSSPLLVGTEYHGIPILHPGAILNCRDRLKDSFFLIASVDRKNKEMFAACRDAGLTKGLDYVNIQELSPLYPTVEVSGVCNLRCISCPRGNSLKPMQKGGFMSAGDYSKVVDKLIREIPFLYLVDLYIWGEPLLNPALPEIIKINNRLGIASGISSNLNDARHLEAVIKAAPAQIRISISGYGEVNYEMTHRGGHWAKLYRNLLLLSEYIRKYDSNTLIEVYFHVNKNNLHEYGKIRKLCVELGYRLNSSISMIFPDYVMDYIEGRELCGEAKRAMDLMLVSVDEMINTARDERNKDCLLRRVAPVINWDLSVKPCCNYTLHNLADSYLTISLEDIFNLRRTHPLCLKCQDYSLHRYFNPEYYSDYINRLLCEASAQLIQPNVEQTSEWIDMEK